MLFQKKREYIIPVKNLVVFKYFQHFSWRTQFVPFSTIFFITKYICNYSKSSEVNSYWVWPSQHFLVMVNGMLITQHNKLVVITMLSGIWTILHKYYSWTVNWNTVSLIGTFETRATLLSGQ